MARIKPKGLVEAQLIDANIGREYWRYNFATYQGSKEVRRASVKYLENLDKMYEEGIGILYAGPNGTGKTTAAMIVLKYLIKGGWDVYATSLGEIVENIQRSWKDNNEYLETHRERCRESTFLLIDDFGAEHSGSSGFVQTVFENLLRYRVQHSFPTFITTNLTKERLEGRYGESSMSLLEGKLVAVVANGEDVRKKKLKKELKGKING